MGADKKVLEDSILAKSFKVLSTSMHRSTYSDNDGGMSRLASFPIVVSRLYRMELGGRFKGTPLAYSVFSGHNLGEFVSDTD